MTTGNTLLDALLVESGMSKEGFARRVNLEGKARGLTLSYNHASVGRWLKGQRPRAPVPDIICHILSARLERPVTAADAGFVATAALPSEVPLDKFLGRATSLWRADSLQHREVLQMDFATGMDAVAPIWEWENYVGGQALTRGGTVAVGMTDVQALAQARSHYEVMYRRAGGLVARSRLIPFLDKTAGPLLRGAYDDTIGRALFREASGLLALVGVCTYDAEFSGLAQNYFVQALRLAQESGDHRFGGFVVAKMINQCLAQGEFRRAVEFADAAARVSGQLSPALSADLRVMQAIAHGQMGDATSAYNAMTGAEQAAARIDYGAEPPEMSYVQPGLIEARLTEALISIGDLKPASQYAEVTLNAQVYARGRVNFLATLATLAHRSGDAEHASALAIEMVDSAQGMESKRLLVRFRKLRRALAKHPTATAAEAVERIDQALLLVP